MGEKAQTLNWIDRLRAGQREHTLHTHRVRLTAPWNAATSAVAAFFFSSYFKKYHTKPTFSWLFSKTHWQWLQNHWAQFFRRLNISFEGVAAALWVTHTHTHTHIIVFPPLKYSVNSEDPWIWIVTQTLYLSIYEKNNGLSMQRGQGVLCDFGVINWVLLQSADKSKRQIILSNDCSSF